MKRVMTSVGTVPCRNQTVADSTTRLSIPTSEDPPRWIVASLHGGPISGCSMTGKGGDASRHQQQLKEMHAGVLHTVMYTVYIVIAWPSQLQRANVPKKNLCRLGRLQPQPQPRKVVPHRRVLEASVGHLQLGLLPH